jgi:ATP-dependent Clp protease ATP-binding subunit ClpX
MTEQVQQLNCNFCGKNRSEVDKLIVANNAGICNECIDLCSSILDKEKIEKIKTNKKVGRGLDPIKIKQFLDQFIIGQSEAKIALSVGVCNHYKRVFLNPKIELEKSNILFFGPTGTGKTLLARTIAKYLDVPFVIADATTLTEAGYVGEDVESVVARLLSEAEYNVERCEQGIIFLDEIDKIGRKSESASLTRDVNGEGVQQALLKLVEGTRCRVAINGGKRHPTLDQVEIDTSKILFIAGGSFVDLDNIIRNRKNPSTMGFGGRIKSDEVNRTDVLPDDFIKFGMIPEFTGRFPITVHTNDLSLDDYRTILLKPKNSLIKQMQFYFQVDGLELELEDSAINEIAQQALEMKIGARGLKTVLEKKLTPLFYTLQTLKAEGVKKIKFNGDCIKYDTLPEFIKE